MNIKFTQTVRTAVLSKCPTGTIRCKKRKIKCSPLILYLETATAKYCL